MKIRIALLLALLVCWTGCITSSPAAAIKNRDDLAIKGDIDGVVKCYSSGYISRVGADKVKDEALKFIEMKRRSIEQTGRNSEMHNINETINGDKADVSLQLGDMGGQGGVPVLFHMIKESGEWKVDGISEAGGK